MFLRRSELPVLIANLIYVPVFGIVALRRGNEEFLLYAAVVLAVGGWVLWKQRSVQFGIGILWGLTGWGLLHLCGGLVPVGGRVLYDVQLVPVVLRYDQLVHAYGFGVSTLVCHHLLRAYLRPDIVRWKVLAILVVLMGCGVGAINEIIEFAAVKTLPKTGVGGYDNTLCDLIFNLLGSAAAVTLLRLQRRFP